MTSITEQLTRILDLERIEQNLFRGQNEARQHRRLFGGQVLAQTLAAAYRTVPGDRPCHSLHGYFLRPGDASRAVLYQVEPIRDGRSFTTRRIKAIQNGEAIFSMDASFQVDEQGLTHQMDLTETYPAADDLEDDMQVAERMWGKIGQGWGDRERPFETRSIADAIPNGVASWIRFRHRVDPTGPRHHLLLAYASDMSLISTAMIPHRREFKGQHHHGPHLQMASLDHALWFHRPFSVNDWILYIRETPTSAGARGFTRGAFYTEAGQLVASVMQEGLIRQRGEPSGGAPSGGPTPA